MKKMRLLLTGAPALLLALSSCTKEVHVFVPNQVNAPLLKEKNEFKGNISAANVQGAYAITDNIAVMVNGQYVSRFLYNDPDPDDTEDILVDPDTRGGLVEAGIGFFKPLDPKKRVIFDVYAGYGRGAFKTLDRAAHSREQGVSISDYVLRTKFQKFFIQPSIGVSHKVVEAAFTPRVSFVNFFDNTMAARVFENSPGEKDAFNRLRNKTVTFLEPTFTVRVGYRYVKWFGQFSVAHALTDNRYDENTNDRAINDFFQIASFNMGVSFNFGQWVKESGR
ncbi:hypothetical protein ACWKWU_21760 [Chitinophaga lutea]